jgi:hypothetical protein
MIENGEIIKFLKGLKHTEDITSVIEIMAESFHKNTGVVIRSINCEWISHHSGGSMQYKLQNITFDMG